MWLSFCSFFAPQGPIWPERGFWLTLNLASSEAAQVRLAGSENGLQATDGPLPWPRTRDDVRGATQKCVVPRSARRLASSEAAVIDLNAAQTPSVWPSGLGRRPKQKKSQPPEAVTTAIAVNALSMSRVNFRPRPIGEIPNADEIEKTPSPQYPLYG